MKRYLIIIEKSEHGYCSFIPDLPGCFATGTSRDDVEKNLTIAIESHLERLKEENIAVQTARCDAEVLLIDV